MIEMLKTLPARSVKLCYDPNLTHEALARPAYPERGIVIGDKFFKLGTQAQKWVVAHETGHTFEKQIENLEMELAGGRVSAMLGSMVDRGNWSYFEGVFGEANPSEAFATCVAELYFSPAEFKKKYPKVYDFIKNMLPDNWRNAVRANIAQIPKVKKEYSLYNQKPAAEPAAKPRAKKAAAPKIHKGVFLKGEAKEKTSGGVSFLVNAVNNAVEINTVARYRSWDDASSSMGGLYGFQSYQGVPITQEELTTHYPELKRYTGLTKSKIGSAKVWFKNVNMPLVVQYKGYAYMVAPTIEDAKAFRQIPESMTKPKLTAEQQKYLDAHKLDTQRLRDTEIVLYHVDAEKAIREAKHIEKQGYQVELQRYYGKQIPLYTVLKVLNPQKTAKPKPKAATKPPRTPAPSVPAILTPAPAAASGMATVQIGLGGGIPPIPGMGAAAAPKPKPRAKKAATPKPKSKAKNGKTATGITLTAAQKKRLAAKGSITIKRGGKFVTVRG